jgi:epoxyqueuosine reductase
VRNVLVAIGNSGEAGLGPVVEGLLDDPSPLVRGMAAWALGRLLPPERVAALRERGLALEHDPEVRAEWAGAAA